MSTPSNVSWAHHPFWPVAFETLIWNPHAHHLDQDGVGERAEPGPTVWAPAPESESFKAIAARALAGCTDCADASLRISLDSITDATRASCNRVSCRVDGDWPIGPFAGGPRQAVRSPEHPTHSNTTA